MSAWKNTDPGLYRSTEIKRSWSFVGVPSGRWAEHSQYVRPDREKHAPRRNWYPSHSDCGGIIHLQLDMNFSQITKVRGAPLYLENESYTKLWTITEEIRKLVVESPAHLYQPIRLQVARTRELHRDIISDDSSRPFKTMPAPKSSNWVCQIFRLLHWEEATRQQLGFYMCPVLARSTMLMLPWNDVDTQGLSPILQNHSKIVPYRSNMLITIFEALQIR